MMQFGNVKSTSGGSIPSGTFLGATLMNSAAFMVASATASPITWTTLEYDALGLWNSGSPTVLTIPAGVGHIRVWGHGHWAVQNTAGSVNGIGRLQILKNGSPSNPTPGGWEIAIIPGLVDFNANTTAGGVVGTPLIQAFQGDQWSLTCDQNTGNPMQMDIAQFSIECYT